MIPSEQPHLETAALTHPGSTGKNNEDRFGLFAFAAEPAKNQPPVLLAVVADGVGGKQAGELAAETAVEVIRRTVAASDGSDPLGILRRAYHESNRAILDRAGEDMEASGMATTATVAWIAGDRLYAANIGNSRLYLLRDGDLRRISIDHSWVEEAVSHGLITPEQARDHPQARVITRHLGSKDPEPDFRLRLSPGEKDEKMAANQGLRLEAGDVLLLCSDGLTEVVYDKEIEAALNEDALDLALQRLTDLANERGGPDNITGIALRVHERSGERVPDQPPAAAAAEPAPAGRTSTRSRTSVYLISSILLVIFIFIGYLLYLFLFQ